MAEGSERREDFDARNLETRVINTFLGVSIKSLAVDEREDRRAIKRNSVIARRKNPSVSNFDTTEFVRTARNFYSTRHKLKRIHIKCQKMETSGSF